MGVTHDAVAAVRQLRVLPLGDEGVGFRDQDLASIRRLNCPGFAGGSNS
jgi:hypothetical protein